MGHLTLTLSLITTGCLVAIAANLPAPSCNETSCRLPDCLCSSMAIPGGLSPSEIPQIVMVSFDEAITSQDYNDYYKNLFDFKNPNGCNIGMTFFLSHDYTDYTLVHDLWQRGHEMASHSVTHSTPVTYWQNLDYSGWVQEMSELRQMVSTFGNVPAESVVGARAPFLQNGGDPMFRALYTSGFHYDSSEPTLLYRNPALWPYTLDYKSTQDCQIQPCPTDSYPGFWEIPLIDYNDTENVPCAELDSCPLPKSEMDTFSFLLTNFKYHYQSNKAPFGLFLHASWFRKASYIFDGVKDFLYYLSIAHDDIYLVTMSQAIDWARDPTPLSKLDTFRPWSCNVRPTSPCSNNGNGITCKYSQTPPGGERYLHTCAENCPVDYPWLGNPLGNYTA